MKKNVIRFFAMFGFLFVLAATPALAQSGTVLKANIPFDFSAANRTLPAGEYTVRDGATVGGTVLIRHDDTKAAVAALAQPIYQNREAKQAMLVFHRYGDQYFLAKVINAGGATGREIVMSKTEKRLIRGRSGRNLAQNNVEPEIVTIIAEMQ